MNGFDVIFGSGGLGPRTKCLYFAGDLCHNPDAGFVKEYM